MKTANLKFVFVLFFFLSLGINFTKACSCIPNRSVSAEYKASSAVFVGRVMNIKEISMSETQVTLCIKKLWKGSITKSTIVKTCSSTACCGFPFVKYADYLVYASSYQGTLSVSLCSRTTSLQNASTDLNILGNPKYTNPKGC